MQSPALLDTSAIAEFLGLSPAWVKKDRLTKRLLPFVRVGSSIRYDLARVREALAATEAGGSAR